MSSRGVVCTSGQKDSYRITTVFLILLHVVKGEICRENQYRPFLRPWCCNSKCGPGTRIARPCSPDDEDGTECEPCGEGFYSPGRDQERCIQKDRCNGPNEEVKSPGTNRTNSVCRCKLGSYREREVCRTGPVCEPGTGATRNGTCEVCPHGKFSNESSRTQPCMAWTKCWKLGFVLRKAGTNISDVVCISRHLPTATPLVEAYTLVDSSVMPVAVWAGLGGVLGLAFIAAIIIGSICACRGKNNRAGTGDRGERATLPVRHSTSLPDQISVQIGEQNEEEEETVPLRPRWGDEVDLRHTTQVRFQKKLPDEGFSTGDDSCSDTLSDLSTMTPANSETAIEISPEQAFNDPEEMTVTEDMIEYLEQHLGRQYLALARKLPSKDETTRLTRTDIDSLKDCQKMDGMQEAIRKTIDIWRTKNGDQANLKGLLIGLHKSGMTHLVSHLCEKYNVSEAAIVGEE